MKRCPRKKDPKEYCKSCEAAERIVKLLDGIMAIRLDEQPQDRWYWMCVRFSRHWRTKLREHVARKRAELVEKWHPILDDHRFIPVRILTGHFQGGMYFPSEDLDGGGSYGPSVRAYEDRYDER